MVPKPCSRDNARYTWVTCETYCGKSVEFDVKLSHNVKIYQKQDILVPKPVAL